MVCPGEGERLLPAVVAQIRLLPGQKLSAQNTFRRKQKGKQPLQHRSVSFPLQAELQAGVAAAGPGVLGHDSHSLLAAHDDQQLPGPGDGGVQNAAVQ